jgi:hypothetical protein
MDIINSYDPQIGAGPKIEGRRTGYSSINSSEYFIVMDSCFKEKDVFYFIYCLECNCPLYCIFPSDFDDLKRIIQDYCKLTVRFNTNIVLENEYRYIHPWLTLECCSVECLKLFINRMGVDIKDIKNSKDYTEEFLREYCIYDELFIMFDPCVFENFHKKWLNYEI